MKIVQSGKVNIFRDEFLGGSSDFDDRKSSEMTSLSVLEWFCTDSRCISILRTNFTIWSNFMIFRIFDCGFGNFDLRNFYLADSMGTGDHVFGKLFQKSLPEKNATL